MELRTCWVRESPGLLWTPAQTQNWNARQTCHTAFSWTHLSLKLILGGMSRSFVAYIYLDIESASMIKCRKLKFAYYSIREDPHMYTWTLTDFLHKYFNTCCSSTSVSVRDTFCDQNPFSNQNSPLCIHETNLKKVCPISVLKVQCLLIKSFYYAFLGTRSIDSETLRVQSKRTLMWFVVDVEPLNG